ncbi:MAG TPA: ion channel [Bacteroidia bacterium]|nr:ion channel [Bacteroidia bacterium]HQK96705.1 ion channel [Bacteroidia bacterium]
MQNKRFTHRLARIRRKEDAPEFGFGSISTSNDQRMMNKDGTANVIRLGEPKFSIINLYHSLVTMPWWKFNISVLGIYLITNFLFAVIYYVIDPAGLGGMTFKTETDRFLEIFFFSAQSLTTVGYGRLNPVSLIDSTVAAIESMVGLLGFALATGLLYGRFSRATAKLLYSDNIIVAPYKHIRFPEADKALMFRILNARKNQLIEIEAQIMFAYNEEVNGSVARKFQQLKLETEKINLLAMSWTIVHPIVPESPLYGLTKEDIESVDAEFVVNIKAIDDTYVQQVYTRTSYTWKELAWGVKFDSVISKNQQGITTIDLKKISSFKSAE